MNVLYCGDGNISDGLIISALSLADNADEKINVYILTVNLRIGNKHYMPVREELAKKLETHLKKKNENSSVTLFDVSDLFGANLPLANIETRFTPCCMLRLFADKVEDLPDKILYLDNDVICARDCSEFYNTDIEGYELCGVRDYYGRWFFGEDYFNSGVLLLNMRKIRETGLFEKCRSMCIEEKMFMPDQSAINKLAKLKICAPRKYNEQRKSSGDTVFRHFTTSFRFFPWFHSVSVKPWQINKMHDILGEYEYDRLLDEYISFKEGLSDGEGNTNLLFN